MPPVNDFLTFANASGANVLTQSAYSANAARSTGVQAGTASSALFNKAQRQSSVMSAALAGFISGQTGLNVLDNGDVSAIIANIVTAVRNAVATDLTNANNIAFDHQWPVGSIWTGTTINHPGIASGRGTWVQQAGGYFLVGVGTATDSSGRARSFTLGASNFGEYWHVQAPLEIAAHAHLTDAHQHATDVHAHVAPAHAHGLARQLPNFVAGKGTTTGSFTIADQQSGIGATNVDGATTTSSGGGGLTSVGGGAGTTVVGSGTPMNVTPPSFGAYIFERIA